VNWVRRSETVHLHAGAFPGLESFLRDELRFGDLSVFWHLGSKHWFVAATREELGEPELNQVASLNHDPSCEDGPKLSDEALADLRVAFLGCGADPVEAVKAVASAERAAAVRLAEEDVELLEMKRWMGKRIRSDNKWYGNIHPGK